MLGHHEPEDGVAHEGQRLVVAGAGMLVHPGAVGERLPQEIAIREGMPQPRLERVHGGSRVESRARRGPRESPGGGVRGCTSSVGDARERSLAK
jgi:hypothetical protein